MGNLLAMEKHQIRKIVGEKNAKGIPLTEEEKNIALKFYTEEEIQCIKHFVVKCNIKNYVENN